MNLLTAFLVTFAVIAGSLIARPSFAADWVYAPNGVGISVGPGGGITGFHKLDEKTFAQGTIAGISSGGLVVGADYAMVFPRAIYAIPELTPYIGGGAFIFSCRHWCSNRVGVDDGTGFGGRIPFGIMLQIPNAPVHVMLEMGPTATIVPSIESGIDAVIGARFLF